MSNRAKLCKIVTNYQTALNVRIIPTLARFGTAWHRLAQFDTLEHIYAHSYAHLSTQIFSIRVVIHIRLKVDYVGEQQAAPRGWDGSLLFWAMSSSERDSG